MNETELYKLIPLEEILKNNSLQKAKYIDDEGYLYSLSRSNISTIKMRKTTPAKFFNLNPYSLANIKNYILINEIPIVLISEDNIKTAKDVITFSCSTHGEFQKSWNEIKNGQYCPVCGRKESYDKKRNNYEDIRKSFENRGYTLLTEVYINNLQKLDFICPSHIDRGIQQTSWADFISNKGCKFCSREIQDLNATKTPEEFKKEVSIVHGSKFTLLEPYKNSNTKIKIYCNDCKSTFYQSTNHLLEGHIGCNCKEKSLGEKIVREYLTKKDLIFQQEYRFSDCKNIKTLPFDFAIFDNQSNLINLIEFQGKQHYEDTHWSKDIKKSEIAFEKRKINDKIKRQYCVNKKINLIEIPYWDIGNIDEILSLRLNKDLEGVS